MHSGSVRTSLRVRGLEVEEGSFGSDRSARYSCAGNPHRGSNWVNTSL